MQIAYLLSNIIIGAYSGTISDTLFKNLWINILKYAKAILVMHAAFTEFLHLMEQLFLEHVCNDKLYQLDII